MEFISIFGYSGASQNPMVVVKETAQRVCPSINPKILSCRNVVCCKSCTEQLCDFEPDIIATHIRQDRRFGRSQKLVSPCYGSNPNGTTVATQLDSRHTNCMVLFYCWAGSACFTNWCRPSGCFATPSTISAVFPDQTFAFGSSCFVVQAK